MRERLTAPGRLELGDRRVGSRRGVEGLLVYRRQ